MPSVRDYEYRTAKARTVMFQRWFDKLVCLMGLGGTRERFTKGEFVWWGISFSLISAGLTAIAINVGYAIQCMNVAILFR